jgi:hypothetical protein
MKKHYFVRAVWDDEAKTYYTESGIHGLFIETPSLEEFEELAFDLGPELIVANHMSAEESASRPVLELITTIVFQKPLAASQL